MVTGRPRRPFVFLGAGVAALLIPALLVALNPGSLAAFVLIIPGTGIAIACFVAFSSTFYFEENDRPSFLDRIRVRRCPYCGAWAAHATRKELSDESVGTTAMTMGAAASDGIVGTKTSGTDRPARRFTDFAVTNLTFREELHCSRCGKTWTRTVTHRERPPNALGIGPAVVSGDFSTEVSDRGDPED